MAQQFYPSGKPKTRRFYKGILWAGLFAGILDAIAAVIHYIIMTGKNPTQIFLFIASGIFGKAAFSGGWSMAFLGLIFHFIIAFIFTLFFFWLYPKIKILFRYKILAGVIYGVFIWLVMNWIVLPLSNAPKLIINIDSALTGIAIIIICVGLPISLIAYRHYIDSGSETL